MQQLDEFRLTLLQQQAELEARGAAIEADIRGERQQLSADWEDQSQERENDEVLAALYRQTQIELHEIHKALQRIEHHNYTRCAECCGEIEIERLRALPRTELCARCVHDLEDAI